MDYLIVGVVALVAGYLLRSYPIYRKGRRQGKSWPTAVMRAVIEEGGGGGGDPKEP